MLLDELEDAGCGIFFEVAIDDLIVLFTFENGGERKDRKWKAAIPGLGGAGVIEDDHTGTSAMKIWNREGVRRLLSFAWKGRRAHWRP